MLMPPPRVPENARAEAVDDIDAAGAHEVEGDAASAQSENRIRGAAVDHGGPATPGQGKRPVRHIHRTKTRVDLVGGAAGTRWSGYQCDVDFGPRQEPREIVDRALQPTEAVQWMDGPCHDGDAKVAEAHYRARFRLRSK